MKALRKHLKRVDKSRRRQTIRNWREVFNLIRYQDTPLSVLDINKRTDSLYARPIIAKMVRLGIVEACTTKRQCASGSHHIIKATCYRLVAQMEFPTSMALYDLLEEMNDE